MDNENPKDWWIKATPMMSGLAFVVALASLFVSMRTCSTSERVAHLKIAPDVKLYLEGAPPGGTVRAYNAGPLSVASVSISRFTVFVPFGDNARTPTTRNDGMLEDTAGNLRFDPRPTKESGVVMDEISADTDPLGELWKFETTLEPRQSIKGQFSYQGSVFKGSEQIAVHVYDITYFRPSDMNEYTKRTLFFDNGQVVYDQSAFTKHSLYGYVMMRFRLSDLPIKKIREHIVDKTARSREKSDDNRIAGPVIRRAPD